jgi:hypothetical protein
LQIFGGKNRRFKKMLRLICVPMPKKRLFASKNANFLRQNAIFSAHFFGETVFEITTLTPGDSIRLRI